MADEPVLLPIQLEAFVLNPAVCGTLENQDQNARIAPITQPNYTFLRIDSFVLQSDVQNHVDLHSTVPASVNPRMTDLGAIPADAARRYRYGVYLHWILPRTFRIGASPAGSGNNGLETSAAEPGVEPPTRWIIVRRVEVGTAKKDGEPVLDFPEYEAWVIESDCLWALDNIPIDMDLQVDVSPFVTTDTSNPEGVNIDQQAEVFIGRKTRLESWPPPRQNTVASLNLLTSSNQLFADFQLQNSNVFSMLDNFQYGDSGNPQYLDEATASYYLLGWYSKVEDDPLYIPDQSRIQPDSHLSRIATRFMTLKNGGDPVVTATWENSTSSIQTLCHGAMYEVNWDSTKKPAKMPADGFADTLSDNKLPAIAVGTTPIDALISYCTARKAKPTKQTEAGGSSRSTTVSVSAADDPIAKLEEDILAIESLLHSRDDGVEAQREAKDTVYNWNYDRSNGGIHYTVGPQDNESQPLEPSDQIKKKLQELNQTQLIIDSCQRMLLHKRWDMFSLWWNYVSDVTNEKDRNNINRDILFKGQTDIIGESITALLKQIETMEIAKGTLLANELKGAKSGTLPFYYRSRDPTILVGGIKTGWQLDFNEDVGVRLPGQVVTASIPAGLRDRVQTPMTNSKLLNSKLVSAASTLLSEFAALQPTGNDPTEPPTGKAFPQFHHSLSKDTHLEDKENKRDQWQGTQPWFPLYSEWEVEYTHIPFKYWSLGSKATRLSANKQVTYGIDDSVVLYDVLPQEFPPPGSDDPEPDIRILSGRSLILPQPTFSLQTKVTQLFQDTPPSILEEYLKEPERKNLLDNINKLSFLSAPFSGLIDGLVTLSRGTHIKPETKFINSENQEEVKVVESARFDKAGFTLENLRAIDNNSALTPYAAMTKFLSTQHCPFKPVTHGQFRFRKFNIIDKFGQALAAISPVPRKGDPPPYYPSISDFYEPQLVRGSQTKANTVREDEDGLCEFMQLPPQINQPARLNASFVMRTGDDFRGAAYWRPATEWENPIWGWIVINYADLGLQFFLPDGIFYREVRWGGPLNALTEPKWIPFSPKGSKEANAQLDALIDKLSLPDYLLSFWKMITTAQNNLPPAPNSYAQFLNSIVGKPLALVNMGWWLELDSPPLENKAINVPPEALKPLIPLPDYSFQVKFGDKEREYDGLVGYFELEKDMKPNAELDLNKIFTYTRPEEEEESDSDADGELPSYKYLEYISEENYPTFKPVFPSPFEQKDPYNLPLSPRDYEARRNRNLQVYGAILDPFTAIHAYSSILPAQALQLPPWTWQKPMDVMTAFFHAGPLNLVQDVNGFDSKRVLTADNWRDVPPVNVALPALGEGEWNWLQPYSVAEESNRVYNSYGMEKLGNVARPGFEKGPYLATEGFLQLRNPITSDKPYPT